MPQVWTSNEQGAPVELCECRNEACEYDFVVGALKAHQEAHGSLSDVAVLYRTHAVGNLVYKALRDHRIPCQTSAADVFARADVAPLVAALRLITNPDDDAAFRAVAGGTRKRSRRSLSRGQSITPQAFHCPPSTAHPPLLTSQALRCSPRLPLLSTRPGPPLDPETLNQTLLIEATRTSCSLHQAAKSLHASGSGLFAGGSEAADGGSQAWHGAAAAGGSTSDGVLQVVPQQQQPAPRLEGSARAAVHELLRKLDELRRGARSVPPYAMRTHQRPSRAPHAPLSPPSAHSALASPVCPRSAQLLQNIMASGLFASLDPQYPPHGAKLLADEMSAGISASEARDQARDRSPHDSISVDSPPSALLSLLHTTSHAMPRHASPRHASPCLATPRHALVE